LSGPWFFQAIADKSGSFKLTEIGLRIAGSSGLRRAQGINLTYASLFHSDGIALTFPTTSIPMRSRRPLGETYFSDFRFGRVYVDLDDTLIRDGRTDARLIGFLYQCRNAQRAVILITRHNRDPDATLRSFRIRELFDAVIHITDKAERKIDRIDNTQGALLIDDSFSERAACLQSKRVLAVDASCVEGLFTLIERSPFDDTDLERAPQ
jgi:hypothetical protein